ncbi:MAG: DNA repair protein RecN [Desulfomonilaceae bacterium]|nr:DNA repair protein RecN [Desulfomonilaceae bacterium]
MLKYLKISHLAIIDTVEVEFNEGFNVLTGETGAGKSILIGALDLLLGARASADMIRTGEDEASVEGLFEISDTSLLPQDLESSGVSPDEVILARRILRNGRSRCFINGNLATLAMLQTVGRSLVSIFGQHEHYVLLDSDEHIEILDRFGGLEGLRRNTSDAYHAWSQTRRNLSRAVTDLEDRQRKNEESTAAIEELTEARLRPDEEDGLVEERDILRNAVRIREKAFEAHQALYSRSGSLMEGLVDVRKAVEYLASVSPKFTGLRDNLEDAVYRLEDIALDLRTIGDTFHADPARLDAIEERLILIRRLKKKHGADVEGLLSILERKNAEAGEILDSRAAVKRLEAELEETRAAYFRAAGDLSDARRRVAVALETAMKRELNDLAMPNAAFLVSFQDVGDDKQSATGLETIEFHLASNPGETARPLARIASGGELSRIMLALKALQTDDGATSTVIFDEVDAGIGGHTAFAVGTRLARVAKRQQVLCVTHLHQIAALADRHLSVIKQVRKGRTHIKVKALDREQRVEELGRMLGASPNSEAVREHVTRLMDQNTAEVSG